MHQAAKGVLAIGVVGSLFTLVVLILGSLWPAMALHALVDISQGVLGWLAFRKVRIEDDLIAAFGESALRLTSQREDLIDRINGWLIGQTSSISRYTELSNQKKLRRE